MQLYIDFTDKSISIMSNIPVETLVRLVDTHRLGDFIIKPTENSIQFFQAEEEGDEDPDDDYLKSLR